MPERALSQIDRLLAFGKKHGEEDLTRERWAFLALRQAALEQAPVMTRLEQTGKTIVNTVRGPLPLAIEDIPNDGQFQDGGEGNLEVTIGKGLAERIRLAYAVNVAIDKVTGKDKLAEWHGSKEWCAAKLCDILTFQMGELWKAEIDEEDAGLQAERELELERERRKKAITSEPEPEDPN